MTLEVYWGSGSPYAWRVLLGLVIKQISYESKQLSFSKGDLRSPNFLAINPRGQVPAIREGSFTLHESIAILRYLEDKEPEPALFGQDGAESSKIWCSIMEFMSYLEPGILSFTGAIFFNHLAEQRNEAIQARQTIEKELTLINNHLTEKPYLVGDRLSAADITLYPFVKFLARAAAKENTAEVSGTLRNVSGYYPALNIWCQKIEAIPGYEKTYPPHWQTKA